MKNASRISLINLGVISVCVVLFVLVCELAERGSDPDPDRFSERVAKYLAADYEAGRNEKSVVFVGSSSIRRWDLHSSFPAVTSLNRGLGGAQFSDLIHYRDELILRHSPEIVVIYAGENDVLGGKSTAAIFDDYQFLVDQVFRQTPNARIVFISIKPSPQKWRYWSRMNSVNARIRDFAESHDKLYFVDVSNKMLNGDSELQQHLYAADGLHLSQSGYEIWTIALGGLLEELARESEFAPIEDLIP